MKSNIIIYFVSILMLFHFSEVSAEDNKIIFFTDAHKKGGYLEAVTKEAFKKAGYRIQIKYMPWKRALVEVMKGENEALMAAYFTAERAEKMSYTDSIGQTEIVFFKLKEHDIKYSRLEDLIHYRIGMIRGAVISEAFDNAEYLDKKEESTPDVNIIKLLKGRIDLLVEQRKVIQTCLRERFPESADSLVALDPPLKISEYHNAFSKRYPGYEKKVQDFNTGLQMIKKDGTYQRIIDSHEHP